MIPLVQAKELSCFYGVVLGLNNVSFTLGSGITGIVGPNGAGKSTLIKLITGQIRPSSGSLTVLGGEPWKDTSVLGRIGYCPEHEHVHSDLLPLEWLRSLALLSGLSWNDAKIHAERALDSVHLARVHWKKRIGSYSKGMRQRVKLAQAILHQPELLILDEPMNGLDPMGRQEIHDILRELEQRGTAIIVSSHILDELQSLCGSFLMLNWGRALASGSQASIRSDIADGAEEIVIRTNRPEVIAETLIRAKQLRGYLAEDDRVILWLKTPEVFYARWPELLSNCEAEIYELQSTSTSLANVFEKVTE